MIKAIQKYGEGSIFAVPLGHELYAIGLITRRKPRSPICFGYFFGPPWRGVPSLADVSITRSDDAVDQCRFGDLDLLNGRWPVIGALSPWRRNEWPLPMFFRQEPLGKKTFIVQYSDDNPAKCIGEFRVDAIPPRAIEASLSGAGAVEIGLRRIFGLPKPE